jgi:prolycopene isomerase
MSAFLAVKIFKEFLLDGGYYPEGGMQALPNALAERFEEFGGELRLSHQVKKIKTKETGVTGVVLEQDGFIPSQYVISNCDARQTFLELIDKECIGREFFERLDTITQTLSTFIIYLGVSNASTIIPTKRNMWFLSQYDLDLAYHDAKKGDFTNIERYLVHVAPEQKTVSAYLNVPFKDKKYWADNKEKLLESLIEKIDTHTLPGLAKHIIYKGASTPQDLYRYTLNYKGAACGWENTPAQLAFPDFRRPSFIQGLYLTGHWTTHGLGIPGVSYLGYDTAKRILMKKKLINR